MNLLSNRSFCDLFQYPIFPWIIYNEEIEKNKNKFRIQERNLNVQMGELLYNNDDKRIKMFKDSYELMLIELKNNNYKLDDNYKEEKLDKINKYIKYNFIEPCHISRAYYFSTNYSLLFMYVDI